MEIQITEDGSLMFSQVFEPIVLRTQNYDENNLDVAVIEEGDGFDIAIALGNDLVRRYHVDGSGDIKQEWKADWI